MEPLKKNKKLDVVEILKDLDKYEPRRRNWVWRKRAEDQHMYQFEYHELSEPLTGQYRPSADADHHN